MGVRFRGGERSSVVREAKSQEIGYSRLQSRKVHWYISSSPINSSYTHVGVLGLGEC